MKFFTSSKNIPELSELSTKDKRTIIYHAYQALKVPEKLVLNIAKLIILIPPFMMLARQHWQLFFIYCFFSTIAYIFIIKPLMFLFMRKHFKVLIDKKLEKKTIDS